MTDESSRTLLDAFDPPDGFVGRTAVFVTMTAESDVLDAALERFTGLSGRARARHGTKVGYLLRDAGSWNERRDVFAPNEVAGLHELRPRTAGGWSRLLHAKLALLGFSARGTRDVSFVRLVVMTGNFTRASMRTLLELVFVAETAIKGNVDPNAVADVREAARFVRRLADDRFHAQAERGSGSRSPIVEFDAFLHRLERLRVDVRPRFFHSHQQPLLAQLASRVEEEVAKGRNFLLCGSGFFEKEVDHEAGPEVLAEIASFKCFSKNAEAYLMVPPENSGQLHAWASKAVGGAQEPRMWKKVARAKDPCSARREPRSLHAKFILIGRKSDESQIAGAHLYLGSGNLSQSGLRVPGKNIECGVFFQVPKLTAADLEHRLFWDFDADPIADDEWRDLESSVDERSLPPIVCCPILHAVVDVEGTVELIWTDGPGEEALSLFLDHDHRVRVDRAGNHGPLRVAVVPESFTVTTLDGGLSWRIPVIDDLGRYAWSRERLASFEDLVLAIRGDGEPDETDEPEDEPVESPGGRARSVSTRAPVPRRYPLYEMARFVEEFGRTHQALSHDEIDDRLDHLERLRDRGVDESVFAGWKPARIDLAAHLRNDAFAPPNMNKAQRERYECIVASLGERWGFR